MNTYNSLYHKTLLLKMEKTRKHYENITNQMFGKVIVDQRRFICFFRDDLMKALGNKFSCYDSSSNIYVSAPGFLNEEEKRLGMRDNKEVAVINISENKVMFKRKGRSSLEYNNPNKPFSQYTKIIKFGRELTPEKVAKYIIRFGTK